MQHEKGTLAGFLIEQLRDKPDGAVLAALIVDLAAAAKDIGRLAARQAFLGSGPAAAGRNASGDPQRALDLAANDAVLRHCESSGLVAGFVSEEMDEPRCVVERHLRGPFLVAFDPLDGSSNVDVNGGMGTIFSVLRHETDAAPVFDDYLQPGAAQVAAGYALYGPATMLVLTVGYGTHGFTLDADTGAFVLTHPDLRTPAETAEFAINASYERFWELPVARYVGECRAGREGDRGRDFNMRWAGAFVADAHRVLMSGGVCLYPRDSRDANREGRIRLLYEASPIAMLIEQAGGLATTGRERLLEIAPKALHERVGVILGSRSEVERIGAYHLAHDTGEDRPFRSPLFTDRSLYRPERGHCGRAATCPQSTL